MTITGTSYFFDRARDRMTALSHSADTLQSQIATGKKLTQPSQDSAAWQRLQGLAQAKADNSAFAGNITLARSVLSQSDTTLQAMQDRLQRATELTIQARNGSLSASDRATIAAELDTIVADLGAMAQTKDGRGQPLFDAAAAGIPVADGITVVANEDPARVFGTIAATLGAYSAQLKSADTATVTAASGDMLTALGAATANVASVQGAVGARAARIELVAATAQDAAAVTETERSEIEDTDLTATIADLQKTMTVLEATQASFSKLTQLSLFNYLR